MCAATRGAVQAARQTEAAAATEFKHTKTFAWVLGSEPPAFSIGYEKPMGPGDSGFTVIFDDAPDPEAVGEDGHPAISRSAWTACSRTTRRSAEDWISRRFGAADLDDNGEWVVGDLSRLNTN